MFHRLMIASAAALAIAACGSSDDASGNGSVGACTWNESGIKVCQEFHAPAEMAQFWTAQWQSACSSDNAGSWSKTCASGYNATCKIGSSASTGADVYWLLHYYSADASQLEALHAGCQGESFTWTTP